MLLMIDNYDSFTYNLVQYFRELGVEVEVRFNDAISVEEIVSLKPSHLVISPGPGRPEEAGASMQIIEHFAKTLPILGVCLGHQCLAAVFGARVIQAARLMHGKTSAICHRGSGLLRNVPSPFRATRYHSLLVEAGTLPDSLECCAWTQNAEGQVDEIMGLRHRYLPVFGLQFHPESVLSEHGHLLLKNFIETERGAA